MVRHALLSASSSARWLACPPSAKRCAEVPAPDASPYALQGTDAHTLCQYKVEHALGRQVKDPTGQLTYFDDEMDLCSDEYCHFVMEQLAQEKTHCKDPAVFVEQHLDFSKWVPEGFGTGDCIIVSDEVLHVIDYKYGVGVLVDATKNSQMMCYALGALDLFDGIYDIQKVVMTIFQPRRSNISTYEINKADLLEWANKVLSPIAKLAYLGKGDYHAGEHCRFCKVKATCRKRAEYNLELAKYDFEPPADLTDEEVDAVLIKADELVNWTNDVKTYALKQAINGKKYPDFKLVQGRSVTKYTDEKAVADQVKKLGYDPYVQKLKGITAMRSLLGKKQFQEALGDLTYKPPGKPTLVPNSDKRPAIKDVKEDFKEEK